MWQTGIQDTNFWINYIGSKKKKDLNEGILLQPVLISYYIKNHFIHRICLYAHTVFLKNSKELFFFFRTMTMWIS